MVYPPGSYYGWLLAVLLFVCGTGLCQAQQQPAVRGRVTDGSRPIAFASVQITETGTGTYTSEKGLFTLPLPAAAAFDSLTLVISCVSKVTVKKRIAVTGNRPLLRIRMEEQSLTLKDVQISAVREQKHSASSIVFDREAILQTHAFSLADVLNKLPGKVTQAPQLQQPQTPSFRTAAEPEGLNAINNSFGIAIFVDGVRMSNDGNMQARSLAIRGIRGGGISSHKDNNQSYDVAYNGFDLRDIPVDNIERIEIIQGIADARYGEMTNGAILITTRAGRTPANVRVNINGGSTQAAITKGFQLKGKAGALNLSAEYYLNQNFSARSVDALSVYLISQIEEYQIED